VTAGVIDGQASHHLRRELKEMSAILPVYGFLINDPEIGLMN